MLHNNGLVAAAWTHMFSEIRSLRILETASSSVAIAPAAVPKTAMCFHHIDDVRCALEVVLD